MAKIDDRNKELEKDQERDALENKQSHLQLNQLENEWEKVLRSINEKKEELAELLNN